ncbi:hypothetical protein KUTeg_002104 [Tegillarca granosa]|uniref:Uncharacterized protein n=1 Tax=Tegillarca granosa TaxID=220873 RepID=A0ABQ9FWZ9_TEGGR|nr:hypothetical protein KUTeg_002104 [Tegillarca granosa]
MKVMNACETKNKAKIRNALAVHYFQPLVYGSECFVDGGRNQEAWHGRADILLNHCTINVDTEADDGESETGEKPSKRQKEEEISPEFSSNTEVKLDSNNYDDSLAQTLAMGIVNAFCEVKKDVSLSNKFIPSFSVTERHIRIIMYSCCLDILLLSEKLEIWEDEELNINTLLLVWFALNFDSFEMKVPEQFLERSPQSDFKKCVGHEVYSVYISDMSKPLKEEIKSKKVSLRAEEKGTPMLIAHALYNEQYNKFQNLMEQKGITIFCYQANTKRKSRVYDYLKTINETLLESFLSKDEKSENRYKDHLMMLSSRSPTCKPIFIRPKYTGLIFQREDDLSLAVQDERFSSWKII